MIVGQEEGAIAINRITVGATIGQGQKFEVAILGNAIVEQARKAPQFDRLAISRQQIRPTIINVAPIGNIVGGEFRQTPAVVFKS